MKPVDLPAPNFTDGRGLYPERLRADVPRGFGAVVNEAAAKEGVSRAEFIRRAVAARVLAQTDKGGALDRLKAKAMSGMDTAAGERAYANAAALIERWSMTSANSEGRGDGE